MANLFRCGSGSNSKGGYALENAGTITATEGTKTSSYAEYNITITEPSDVAQTDTEWGETILVAKTSSVPTLETDGTILMTNKVRGQYSTNPLVLRYEGTDLNKTYYLRAFHKTKSGIIARGYCPNIYFTPSLYTYMMSKNRGISHGDVTISSTSSVKDYSTYLYLGKNSSYVIFKTPIQLDNVSWVSFDGNGRVYGIVYAVEPKQLYTSYIYFGISSSNTDISPIANTYRTASRGSVYDEPVYNSVGYNSINTSNLSGVGYPYVLIQYYDVAAGTYYNLEEIYYY